ncbi:hypothetical protein [Acanthopleuribacter pedis]|uniref:Uncharacterized protein n=1 Tax=Acanthopleuribacter pedis TaxID=442870 RepID=A0A8J7QHF9_9BACT|nr:hypothetical protein [Acanthopleuribacter pedis]MBO1320546.1 hypothetical protein [Acanthopleuribacter pedis]
MFGLFWRQEERLLWERVGNRLGARQVKPWFYRGPTLIHEYRHWEIMLSLGFRRVGQKKVTRVGVRVLNPDGLHMRLFPENLLVRLGKMVGMQDIQVGHAPFDDTYLIQSNQPKQVKALLSDPQLQQAVLALSRVQLCVKPKQRLFFGLIPTRNKGEITLDWGRLIKSEETLIAGIQAVICLLDRLAACDLIDERPALAGMPKLFPLF